MPFSSTAIQTDPYTPNGATAVFPFFFLALSEDEIQVVLVASDGTETLLTSGFDVVGIGNPDGGYVEFTVPPAYIGQQLIIRAAPTYAQLMDFENQGPYNPREVNKALDRLHQIAIQLRDYGGLGTGGGSGSVGTVTWASVQNKPLTFTPSAHTHAAADIISGVLDAARIPSLDASKIGSGTLATARVPSLDASKITSGVLDPARIPVTSGGVVSPGAIANLTAPQQALIVEGTLVTTTDGRQWRYSGSGSKVLEASYVELASSTTWTALTGKPPELVSFAALSGVADTLAYFSGVDTLSLTALTATGRALAAMASQNAAIAYTSPLTTKGDLYTYTNAPARLPVGANGQTLLADSTQATGLRWATPTSPAGMFNEANFVSVFSGTPDGVTNNDAALTAAEASAYQRIYLPEGRYLTTIVPSTGLSKTYVGPGQITNGSGGVKSHQGFGRYAAEVHPSVDQLSDYGMAENLQFSFVESKYIAPGMRKNFDRYKVTGGNPQGYSTYFWAPSTPHFQRLINFGGWSGFSGLTSTAINSGVHTSVDIVGGAAGWNIGDTIGFAAAMDGYVAETRVLTGVAGSTISWAGPLSATYPIGSVISHGYRTMNSMNFAEVTHLGGGDAYAWVARMVAAYTPLASQTSFEHRATIGIIGGDMTLTQPGNYATGWEAQYIDTGVDVGVIARVESYVRTVDTGNFNCTWLHDLAKMDGGGTNFAAFGLKRIDGIYATAVGCRTGFDFTRSTALVAAIALPLGEKIGFDAAIVAPGPGNGNGNVATTINGMSIAGHASDGTSKYIEITAGGTNTTKVRPDYLETSKFLGTGASGVSANIKLSLSGVVGASTYFIFDSTANIVALYKNNVQVATW